MTTQTHTPSSLKDSPYISIPHHCNLNPDTTIKIYTSSSPSPVTSC